MTEVVCKQGHSWNLHRSQADERPGRAVACPKCQSPPTLESLGAPAHVAAAVERLQNELKTDAKDHVAGLILYGGLARGRFRVGQSDVDLVVLLRDVGEESLNAIAQPLQRAWRSAAVEPWILNIAEVASIADVFATKVFDIQEHHIVLFGEDPFVGLHVVRSHLRWRVEQELRNMAMRLRRRYVSVFDDKSAQCRVLRRIARPLAIELAALLRLCEKQPAEIRADDRSVQIFEAAAIAFDLDREALATLAALRLNPNTSEGVPALYTRVLRSIDAAIVVADRIKETSE